MFPLIFTFSLTFDTHIHTITMKTESNINSLRTPKIQMRKRLITPPNAPQKKKKTILQTQSHSQENPKKRQLRLPFTLQKHTSLP